MAPPEGTTVCTACVGEPAREAAPAGKVSSLYEVPLTAQASGHRTEVAAGAFAVVLDAGRALGGQESGPSPVQAFVSSIVGCSQVRGYHATFSCSLTAGRSLVGSAEPPPLPSRRCPAAAAGARRYWPLTLSCIPPCRNFACTLTRQITLQLVAQGASVQLGDISWAAHGVFDTRRLLGSSESDASPRFHSIAITGTVVEDVPQSKLDELA